MIVEPAFFDHWKTRMLIDALGDEAAPIYVMRLWAHCQNQRQDTFDSFPTEAIKAICRFPGQAGTLESSLVASGFIRRDGESLVVVNWSQYNSSLIAAWCNGKRGGRPPKNPAVTHGLPSGNPEETHGKPNPLSSMSTTSSPDVSSLKEKKSKNFYSESFERWYLLYPKKVGKDDASQAFVRVVPKIMDRHNMNKEEAIDWLCSVTEIFASSPAGQAGTWTPHPSTWLNQGRYDDDRTEWQRSRDAAADRKGQQRVGPGQRFIG